MDSTLQAIQETTELMVRYATLRNHLNTNRAWQGSQALKIQITDIEIPRLETKRHTSVGLVIVVLCFKPGHNCF